MYSMKKYQNMKTYRIFRIFDENKVNFSIRLKFEKVKFGLSYLFESRPFTTAPILRSLLATSPISPRSNFKIGCQFFSQ